MIFDHSHLRLRFKTAMSNTLQTIIGVLILSSALNAQADFAAPRLGAHLANGLEN